MIYVTTPCPLATHTAMHPRLLRCYFGKFQWRSSVDQGALVRSMRGHFHSSDDLDSQQLQSYDNAIGGSQHTRSVANGVSGSPRKGEQPGIVRTGPAGHGKHPSLNRGEELGTFVAQPIVHRHPFVPLIPALPASYPINVAHGRTELRGRGAIVSHPTDSWRVLLA